MSPLIVFGVIAAYFGLLMAISYFTSKNSDNKTFFTGNKESPWYLVAYGMVGASLSGVTFISVPGEVGNTAWTYLQFVMGNMVGYAVIAFVLIPLFYKLNLISIYEYLKDRFGIKSYRTGASFFIISQTIGASFRLFLAALVLQIAFFNAFGIPFWVTVLITILLIWLYTYKAGIKTIVYTDTLQTTFLLVAVIISIVVILQHLDLNVGDLYSVVASNPMSKIFEWDWLSDRNFFKTFLAGVFITIAMNGLDQNVMQKNLTCRNIKDAQKNILWFSITFFLSTMLFLTLGILIYEYALSHNITIPERSDDLYPLLALNYFGILAGTVFLIGIVAAAFSSADSALTALTTSFCVDILEIEKKQASQKNIRQYVHIGFTVLMFTVIVIFNAFNDSSVVSAVFKVAGFTYGPLLGLFAFGLLFKHKIRDKFVPYICILSPIISLILDRNSEAWFNGFSFGFEILLVNAIITMVGLWMLTKRGKTQLA
ncbi:sodium:solute symporter [Arenibacter lacus]|uniref:sodium:solute symporter n=1 Tax=Arenibacter lacus TaxID=2608629 RepID=UPI00123CBE74|nr:sodium:solute symporter [Arenibacter lacus]